MKHTILVHGAPEKEEFFNPDMPSPSNSHWFPWLQKELSVRNEACEAFEYPKPYDPTYEAWLEVFNQHTIDEETILIGHSCGGGFILRYLTEHPDAKVYKVFLIAPWLDPAHTFTENFFDFDIDPHITHRNEIHVFVSSDDEEPVLESIAMIKEKIPDAHYHEYADKGHFNNQTFPELLALL
jgi:uncharacterized protein